LKIYYKWRLKNIRTEIDALKREIDSPLADNYTDHARLRSLTRLEEQLQQRLSGQPSAAAYAELERRT
jgi:hypothetical protein